MGNVPFTIEEENLICIYHKHDRRRTIAAISDALPDMDADMRPLAEQTIHKLHNITDAAFEETQMPMKIDIKCKGGLLLLSPMLPKPWAYDDIFAI